MIHVCYAIYDRDGHYSKFVGASIVSVFENATDPITIHILHDDTLSVDNRDKFLYLAGRYGQRVEFYNVETLCADRLEIFKSNLPAINQSNYSIATLYRLLIPSLLRDMSRVIYLDADILVHRNIRDLWNVPLDNQILAAVPEFACGVHFEYGKFLIMSGVVEGEDYMNSGVMLMDLDRLRSREDEIWDKGCAFVSSHPECLYFDQDILNYCFSTEYLKLTPDFNCFVDAERLLRRPNSVKHYIYHFLSKSLRSNLNDCFNRLYFDYLEKTPWFGVEAMRNAFQYFDELQTNHQLRSIYIIQVLRHRDRAFLTNRENFEVMQDLFGATEDELMIDLDALETLTQIIDVLREDRSPRKKILFVLSKKWSRIRSFFLEQNFVEGTDFVNAMDICSQLLGFPIDSHSLVRAL